MVLLAAVLASVLALVGCSTDEENLAASSDGFRIEVGALLMSNIMVLSAAEGQPGTVLGAVKNNGDDSVEVSVGLPGGQASSLEVAAGETLLLGPEDRSVRIPSMPVPVGATVELRLGSARDGSTTVAVPVLDDTFPRYEDLVPAPTS